MSSDFHHDYSANKHHGLSDTHAYMLAQAKEQDRINAANAAARNKTMRSGSSYGNRPVQISWNFFWGCVATVCGVGLIGSFVQLSEGKSIELWMIPAMLAGLVTAILFIWKKEKVRPIFYRTLKISAVAGVIYVIASAFFQSQ